MHQWSWRQSIPTGCVAFAFVNEAQAHEGHDALHIPTLLAPGAMVILVGDKKQTPPHVPTIMRKGEVDAPHLGKLTTLFYSGVWAAPRPDSTPFGDTVDWAIAHAVANLSGHIATRRGPWPVRGRNALGR